MAEGRPLRVTLVYSPAPREVREWALDLSGASVGIWGRKAGPDDALCEGDRIEVYRPLRVDPKVARRERFRTQGARSAGLFATRRPGAKPGY